MRRLSYAMLGGIMVIAACNDARKPNDSNFRSAIDQYLQSHGEACTWFGQPFPIDISESQHKLAFGIAPQMAVLEQAGLVHSIDTVATIPGIFGGSRRQHVKRYEPTETGKQYLRQSDVALSQAIGFCYGAKTVDSIINWTEPTAFGPATQTEVTYTYKIPDLAAWAKRADIQNEFGDVRAVVNGISKTNESVGLQLTKQGWEVPVH
jgi:hypothetical protein